MKTPLLTISLAMFVGWLCAGARLSAAEITLRSNAEITGNMVMLSDVADIRSDNARDKARLSAIDLSPAPGAGGSLSFRAREIQDILALRGFSEKDLPVTGASRVTVKVVAARPAQHPKTPVTEFQIQGAERRVREALTRHLKDLPGGGECTVKMSLTKDQTRFVVSSSQVEITAGGKAPFTGTQTFEVTCRRAQGEETFSVVAELLPPPTYVATTRPIAKGTILKSSDLKLRTGQVTPGAATAYTSIADAVGKEASRNISVDQIVDDACVQRPILVHKGHLVKVYSLAEGVTVETKGRAREDGAAGDLVSVESIAERKPYFAKVSGDDEVEVYAQIASVSPRAR